MLVASGQGLIDVRTPNHRADPTPTMNSVIFISLWGLVSHGYRDAVLGPLR